MFDKFTDRARKVMGHARQEAQKFNHEYIGTEHVLLGLIQEGTGVASSVLRNLDVEVRKIRAEIEKTVSSGQKMITIGGKLPFTQSAKKVLDYGEEEAKKLGHNYIGTEHLLLGLLHEKEGVAATVLQKLGVKLEDVKREVHELLGASERDDASGASSEGEEESFLRPKSEREKTKTAAGKSKTPALDAFGRDLTELAYGNKLDPVIGRDHEIERIIQILSRYKKNNPVLLGEAGVGKTAIVEGLAQRIVKGDVPEILIDKRIVVLDLALMVAGTKYRGQFEERIKAIMNEVKRVKNVILFIDELHTLVGAGGAEGAIDAANVLKPALSRGEMQCIGATTLDEYRKHIEKDGALERRFQTVVVDPPNDEETMAILHGLRGRYEEHHKVKYTDEALKLAINFATRYITARFLPDKAIDVIDEAGACVRLKKLTRPSEINEFEEKIKDLELAKDEAIHEQDFEKAADLRDQASKMRQQLDDLKQQWHLRANSEDLGVVDATVITETVAIMTGVPMTRIEKGEAERLLQMENHLHNRVISQHEAINAISRALRRSRSGLKDPRRPMGSFIFAGPTGVGKTLLAKTLTEFMFGQEDALIQIDMSEYMEKFNVSRLTGAPPGYVGYDEGGQLTEKVRRRPYAVVLFDEIEKAHGDIYNMLLQIMEEGKLTDSYGRKVDFRNTIIIMTTNIGSDIIQGKTSLGFRKTDSESKYEDMVKLVMGEIRQHFRPEFLNRLDEMIVFRSLVEEDLKQIIELELDYARTRLKQHDIELDLTDQAKQWLLDYVNEDSEGQDYGARPLRRAIEHKIEDFLSEEILRQTITEKDSVKVRVKEGHLFFDITKGEKPKEVEETTEKPNEKIDEKINKPAIDADTDESDNSETDEDESL
ncbi:MAG: ATP-dependent Clp protease ATP-binding subunit [Planctomycetes bacterium]|nr:ATP-dependent Clp protease ATP-binding subunit [Planctomycetota bacterium]